MKIFICQDYFNAILHSQWQKVIKQQIDYNQSLKISPTHKDLSKNEGND